MTTAQYKLYELMLLEQHFHYTPCTFYVFLYGEHMYDRLEARDREHAATVPKYIYIVCIL